MFLLLKCDQGEEVVYVVACQSVVGRLWSVGYSIFHEIGAKKMCSVSVSSTQIIIARRYSFLVLETLGIQGTVRGKTCSYLTCTC